jgi:hypothetical protein
MKIRDLKSTLASVGLLVVITLAGVAVSLAQDSPPAGLGYASGFHHSSPGKASRLGGDVPCVGLVPDSGDLGISHPRLSDGATVFHSASVVAKFSADFAGVKPRKIALHLLDSVLLI